MAQSAGARITTMDGRPYSVFERSMLATNSKLHDDMLSRFTGPATQGLAEKGEARMCLPNCMHYLDGCVRNRLS